MITYRQQQMRMNEEAANWSTNTYIKKTSQRDEQEEHQYPDQEIYWETIIRNMSIEGRIRGSLQERMQRGVFSL